MARMDVEDLSPHRQMILIGQSVNMVNTYNQNLYSHPNHTILSHSLPATVCPVPPPPHPGGQRQVKNQLFPGLEFFRLKVSYTVVPEEPKKSCSLDNEENTLKCFSFQVGRLTIGWWNEAPAWFHFLSVEPWHISAEHLCDGCELREEEVKQGTLQRAEGLGSSLHRLPLRCHGWGEVFQPYLLRLRLKTLDDNIAQNGVKMCSLGERPLQGKFLLCLLNGGDKVIGVHQVPVARQFRLQKGPEKLAHHRIHLWWALLSNLSQNLFTPSWV